MFLFIAALLLWLPALAGWALPWAWLRQRLGGPSLGHVDGSDVIAGFAALAAISVLINFVLPLNSGVSGLTLLAGWLLLAVRLYRARPLPLSIGLGLLALAWIIPAAQLASFPPNHYDSGLYHLQGIQWTHTAAVPLGLANLHGRFGFNSTTMPLATLLQIPLWGQTTAASPNVLGALLLCAYGAELLSALRRPGPRVTRTTLFLALGATIIWSVVNFIAVSSPTSDWAIVVVTLLAVACTLHAIDDPAATPVAIATTTLFALFALTVKLSALPLFGLPAALALYAYRQRQPLPMRLLLALVTTVGVGLLLPWLARGVALSGCLAYPVAVTCFPTLPWAVPRASVESEAAWVISWARIPYADWAATLTGWGWLPTWLKNVSADATFVISLLLLVGGVVVWAAVRESPTTQGDRRAVLVIGLPLLAGLVYWFFTAPDVRFVAGSFWGLGLLSVSLAYHRLAQAPRRGRGTRLFRVASLQVCALLALGSIGLMGFRSMAYLSHAGPVAYLFDWPVVEPTVTTTLTTLLGDSVHVPTESNQCWLAPLPCTPYFNASLEMKRDGSGKVRQFSIAQPP